MTMIETIPFSGKILCDLTLELGEGPTFDPATGTAWWFNIKAVSYTHLTLPTKRIV